MTELKDLRERIIILEVKEEHHKESIDKLRKKIRKLEFEK